MHACDDVTPHTLAICVLLGRGRRRQMICRAGPPRTGSVTVWELRSVGAAYTNHDCASGISGLGMAIGGGYIHGRNFCKCNMSVVVLQPTGCGGGGVREL